MDRLTKIKTLVSNARFVGLRMRVDGGLLRINGPRKATAIAKELLDRKVEVIEYLASEAQTEAAPVQPMPAENPPHLNQFGENVEAHDSALFNAPIVEVTFYTGERIQIPQQSTPEGWVCPF
jgi:hypothetical protein